MVGATRVHVLAHICFVSKLVFKQKRYNVVLIHELEPLGVLQLALQAIKLRLELRGSFSMALLRVSFELRTISRRVGLHMII